MDFTEKEWSMEGQSAALAEKLQRLLREAAEVSLELEKAEGRRVARPHYTQIEARAHQLGQRLSREVQQRRMVELVAEAPILKKCPACGTPCQAKLEKRTVTSIDGLVEVSEQRCECPVCRRAFFPSPGGSGV